MPFEDNSFFLYPLLFSWTPMKFFQPVIMVPFSFLNSCFTLLPSNSHILSLLCSNMFWKLSIVHMVNRGFSHQSTPSTTRLYINMAQNKHLFYNFNNKKYSLFHRCAIYFPYPVHTAVQNESAFPYLHREILYIPLNPLLKCFFLQIPFSETNSSSSSILLLSL